jgi:hypothetical protein
MIEEFLEFNGGLVLLQQQVSLASHPDWVKGSTGFADQAYQTRCEQSEALGHDFTGKRKE